MQTPLQLTFRGASRIPMRSRAHVNRRAEKLERFFDRIVSCHVVVELAGHHQNRGERYRITINLGLPGHEILVSAIPSRSTGSLDNARETGRSSRSTTWSESWRIGRNADARSVTRTRDAPDGITPPARSRATSSTSRRRRLGRASGASISCSDATISGLRRSAFGSGKAHHLARRPQRH